MGVEDGSKVGASDGKDDGISVGASVGAPDGSDDVASPRDATTRNSLNASSTRILIIGGRWADEAVMPSVGSRAREAKFADSTNEY